MEIFQGQDNFIIVNGQESLWCNRSDAGLQPRFGVDLGEAWSLKCRGIIYGVIGKIQFFPGADWRLLVISKRTLLGLLPGDHQVYRIDKVAVLTLSSNESLEADLDPCEQHQSGGRTRKLLGVAGTGSGSVDNQQKGLGQTWSKIKTAASIMKDKNVSRDLKDKEKLERRFVEELLKMFNESESFYYSPTGDLTNSLQRQFSGKHDPKDPVWKRCDKRFFWNEFMVKDLLTNENPKATQWIIPIIQGYCKITHCINTFEDDDAEESESKRSAVFPPEDFDLVLISRRSVRRAGTRYRRRGVDENGDVANYVETEQIVCTNTHNVSFVQVRGSVPVYWSQPGYKYRPPPRLDKDDYETRLAFRKHFDHQLEIYKSVAVISLVDQTGREKIINDVFMDNILAYNSPCLSYVTFDFHEYCRGMRFENVSVLVESIPDVIKEVRYCWTDDKGIICDQRGVFRVNCMDCLDRTNVVQAALARHVVEQQLKKLGKLLPDQILPGSIRTSFQEMWASNGDAISRQYAGTAAMKGDFTRTGERKFTGVMKDGYNSANRYYLNRFKAAYRQTLIDMMLGNPVTEDIAALIAAMKNGPEEDQWTMEREECVAQLIQHCKQLLLADDEGFKSGWALVDPFYSPDGDVTQDQDVVILLTYQAYYVASYDDEAEKITQYERIALEDLDKIEIGFEGAFRPKHLFIRIHRKYQGHSGYFHTLRTIQPRTADEARSVLLTIAEAFLSVRFGLNVAECRLDRKKSKPPPSVTQISSKSRLSGWSKPSGAIKSKSAEIERKSSEPSFAFPLHHSRLRGLRTSYSDTCLVQRRLGDLADEFQTSSSAPQSCLDSSGSDEDEDSGDTDDMESYDNTSQGANTPKEGDVVQEVGTTVIREEADENCEKLEEIKSEKEKSDIYKLQTADTERKLDTTSGISIEEGQPSQISGFLVGAVTEEEDQPLGTLENNNQCDRKDEEIQFEETGVSEDSKSESTTDKVEEVTDEHEEKVNETESEIISGEQLDKETEKENGSILHVKQENGVVKFKKLHNDDLEIQFPGATVALRVCHSSGELGTLASSRIDNTGEVVSEKRRFTARFLSRVPGNRVPKMNIFATAQARGRTLIPELRSKLSSFSQQVRSRSPRLSVKRPGRHSELNEKHKQLKGNCRTRIIEL